MVEPNKHPWKAAERRFNLVLYDYWSRAKGDRLFPSENALDPHELEDIWDHCFCIQIRDINHVRHYNYSFLGSEIVKAYRRGDLQEETGAIVCPTANLMDTKFTQVMLTRRPLIEEGECENGQGQVVKFRQCMFPLGPDDETVAAIFGGLNYKIYPTQNKD